MTTLQSNCGLQIISKTWTCKRKVVNPGPQRKAFNSSVEYSSWEYKSDANESDGNMFNPIFLNEVQGWAIGEPIFRKP